MYKYLMLLIAITSCKTYNNNLESKELERKGNKLQRNLYLTFKNKREAKQNRLYITLLK
jgi:hypothetical protein